MSNIRELSDLALNAKAWPFQEASKILKRVTKAPPKKGYVLFETGYGPSGLPHIGTFGEVLRTTMVRNAFEMISDIPTKLFAFSDDMDGLRKVPNNVPNQDMLHQYLNKPLTTVPDPFGCHDSFADHNNASLRAFLDQFGFDYEFKSSTDFYRSGKFDTELLNILRNYDAIQKIMLPSLREERRQSYSPFLPICEKTGNVLQVPVIETNPDAGTIIYLREDGEKIETRVTGGKVKLQWKPDWGMRWAALGVDYEMSGKDLIDSVKLSTKITRALGAKPPETLTYELFLDENGEKISKSKGNGLTIEDWLKYAPPESLSLFMYVKPKTGKRLFFDIIPKNVDEYLQHSEKFSKLDAAAKLESPLWHIHNGDLPAEKHPLSFALLLNLVAVCNSEDKQILWGFISKYDAAANAIDNPMLDKMVGYAIAYYRDFVKPYKEYLMPTGKDRAAMEDLLAMLNDIAKDSSASDIQSQIFEIGKKHQYDNLRDWFKACYQILLGQQQGPRMGSFIALYGVDETCRLIEDKLGK